MATSSISIRRVTHTTPWRDTLSGNGLIVAGNNPQYGTPGVSKTDSDWATMGFCTTDRGRLESEEISTARCCGPRGMGNLLRSR